LDALGINLGYLISQIVNFALLFALLSVFLYKPVMRMLDERAARIRKGLEDSERAEKRLARIEADRDRRIQQAEREAREIVARAKEEARAQREEILAQARAEAEELLSRMRKEIEWERQHAVSKMREQIVDVVIAATARVIEQSLDETTHRRLIHDFLDELEQLE